MALSLLSLPFEVRQEILAHALVNTEYPFHLVYNGRIFLGGQLLGQDRQFLAILRTCRKLHTEGTRIFFQRNVFVYGDFLYNWDKFEPASTVYGTCCSNDARICDHPWYRVPCNCAGSSRYSYRARNLSKKETDPKTSQICERPLTDDHLRLIRRLILLLHDPRREDGRLYQSVLFMEQLDHLGVKLRSLFIIGDRWRRDGVAEPPETLRVDKALPRTFDFLICMTPPLRSMCERSPSLHIHTCSYHTRRGVHWDFNLRPSADTAMSICAYLSVVELGATTFFEIPKPGLSFSTVSPEQNISLSDDTRYLLSFESLVVRFHGSESRNYGRVGVDALHREGFSRSDPFRDHAHMIRRRLPWFTYQFFSSPALGGGRKTASLVQALFGRLPEGIRSWTKWRDEKPLDGFYNTYDHEIETDENEVALKKSLLEETCFVSNMKDAWTADSVQWLREMLERRYLFDVGMAPGQHKITEYYAGVAL